MTALDNREDLPGAHTQIVRALFENAAVAVALIRDHRLIRVNTHLEQMLGYEPGELQGEPERRLYPDDQGYAEAIAHRHRMEERVGRSRFETTWRRADEDTLKVLLTTEGLDPEASALGVLSIAIDISERKRAQAALKDTEAKLRLLTKASSEMIYEWRTSDDSVRWTGDITGKLRCDPDEVPRTASQWLALVHPDDRPSLLGAVNSYHGRPPGGVAEYRVQRSDGEWLHLIDTITPLFSTTGGALRYTGCCRDVTEQRRLESELIHARNKAFFEARATSEASPSPRTVLLADNEVIVRNLGRRVLERAGYQVLLAEDGRRAIQRFRQHAPEVVCALIDWSMPELDGQETIRVLREIRPDLPVVISSGFREDELASSLLKVDKVRFLQKPYHPTELIRKIEALLTSRG